MSGGGQSNYGLTQCPQCGSGLLPGRICPSCQVAWEPVGAAPPAAPASPAPLQSCPWCGGALSGGACFRCRVEWVPKSRSGGEGVARASKPTVAAAPAKSKSTQTRGKTLLKKALRWIPPVRLVWIFLGIMILVGGYQSSPAGEGAWAAVLGLSVGLDLIIQLGRFGRKLRFPDAALAIANFLVILIAPGNATIGSSPNDFGIILLSTTAVTIVMRHLLRQNGRPWFNPTALGLALGWVFFALPVAWAVGGWPAVGVATSKVNELALAIIFGITLIVRQRNTWRFPAFFFATAVPLQIAITLIQGGTVDQSSLSLTILPPLTIFYGLWMVPEPRTAPSAPKHMWRFSILVGVLYVLLGTFWTLQDASIVTFSAWSAIDPFVALFAGNIYAIVSRRVRVKKPVKADAPMSLASSAPSRSGAFAAPMFYGGFEIVGAPGPNPPPFPGGY